MSWGKPRRVPLPGHAQSASSAEHEKQAGLAPIRGPAQESEATPTDDPAWVEARLPVESPENFMTGMAKLGFKTRRRWLVVCLLIIPIAYHFTLGAALAAHTHHLQTNLPKQRALVRWLVSHHARINASLTPQPAPLATPILLGRVMALMQQQGIAKRALTVRVLPGSRIEIVGQTVAFDRLLQAIFQLKRLHVSVQHAKIFATQSTGYVNARIILENQTTDSTPI